MKLDARVFVGHLNAGAFPLALFSPRSSTCAFVLRITGGGPLVATYYFASDRDIQTASCASEALEYFARLGPGLPLWYNVPLGRWRAFRPLDGGKLRAVPRWNAGVYGLAFSYTFRAAS